MNNNCALLVLDMQEGIAREMDNIELVIKKNKQAISIARHHDIPVIFVIASFEPNFSDVSRNNKFFTAIKNARAPMTHGEIGTKVLEELSPQPNESIIHRNRISSFVGSNLEVLLRSMKVENLVLTGVATSGAILSTALESADKDYITTILSDAIDDPIPKNHQFLLEQILPMSSKILTIQQWEDLLNK